MIRYALACGDGHEFESWFASAASFDTLAAGGHISCPECGGTEVSKTLMAPRVRTGRGKDSAPEQVSAPLSKPATPKEAALAELRAKVEANSEYVGLNFAKEARAIHDGNSPARAIYGEAKLEDARRLVEDGVPVAPLPFTPRARAN